MVKHVRRTDDGAVTNVFKKYWLILGGGLLMVAGVGISAFGVGAGDVPNDPNIGGGVLFVFGVAMVIVGSILAWATRPPPPPMG